MQSVVGTEKRLVFIRKARIAIYVENGKRKVAGDLINTRIGACHIGRIAAVYFGFVGRGGRRGHENDLGALFHVVFEIVCQRKIRVIIRAVADQRKPAVRAEHDQNDVGVFDRDRNAGTSDSRENAVRIIACQRFCGVAAAGIPFDRRARIFRKIIRIILGVGIALAVNRRAVVAVS